MASFKLSDIVFDVLFTGQKNATFLLEAVSKCGIKFKATLTADESPHIW